jgi:hypothetical protein
MRKKLALLLVLVAVSACAANPFTCREMTWPDPTGGQAPPEHFGAEEAVLWSAIGWTVDNSTPVTEPVVTPCGDQLPCSKVAALARNMGKVTAVERCAVRWLPQETR